MPTQVTFRALGFWLFQIAAALSTRSPFVAPLDKREAADQAKKSFAEAGSDLIGVTQTIFCIYSL